MRVLILGGTQFLGRHFVEVALALGHQVTVFNRGQSGPLLYPDAEKLVGDRVRRELDTLRGHQWDVAIDTAGYLPNLGEAVRDSAELLKDSIGHYTFISSIEVYPEMQPGGDETTPVRGWEGRPTQGWGDETYGIAKAYCESVVAEVYGECGLNLRAGMIVGPYNVIDRFPYWIRRVAQGGEVLAPEDPQLPVQLIDARDLAEWTYRLTTARKGGVYHATGPDYPPNLDQVLDVCRSVSGSDASFTWVPGNFLVEQGVSYWHELPLWAPHEMLNFQQIDVSKAMRDGLTFRPLSDTVRDTLAWDRQRRPEEKRPDAAGLAGTRNGPS